METLHLLKEYLKELDYPNIHILNDDQVADVFNNQNRSFFITWFLLKMDPNIQVQQDFKNNLNTMADILHENGFCKSSEKNKFVQGDNSFDITQQVIIIKRMLKFLIDIQIGEENTNAQLNTGDTKLNVHELACFVEMDINLFPMYGPTKIRTVKDRKEQTEKNLKEIEQIKEEISILKGEKNESVEYDTSEKQEDYNKVSALEGEVLTCKEFCSDLSYLGIINNNECPTFSSNFIQTISQCNNEVQNVAKIVDSFSILSNFTENADVKENHPHNENHDKIIKHLVGLSNELLNNVD